MLDELRDRVISFLSRNRVCVIATSGLSGPWAVAAQYDNSGLELNSCLPRWSDTLFNLEQEPNVIVVIQSNLGSSFGWLQYRGIASISGSKDEQYVHIHIKPKRIDLIDESAGWGARETLDL
jgi:hypothetical protein